MAPNSLFIPARLEGVSADEGAWALVDPPAAGRPRYVGAESHLFVAGTSTVIRIRRFGEGSE
jgi:hypothetical protein